MDNKITMSKSSNLTIAEAFDLFIRKCKVKNLTDKSIHSYETKIYEDFIGGDQRKIHSL